MRSMYLRAQGRKKGGSITAFFAQMSHLSQFICMSSQMRKVQITINNAEKYGLTHSEIIKQVMRFNPVYCCLSDEIGPEGTPHTHVFFCCASPFRFDTVKRRFPVAHIEEAYGSCQANRDYIRKEGIWAGTAKAETSIPGTFEEFGTMPDERAEKAPAMAELIADLDAGKRTPEIIRDNPKYGFKSKDIDTLRDVLKAEDFATCEREISVIYKYGPTDTGKTRSIFAAHPPEDIFRLTHYGTQNTGVRFDGYHGQPVLVFEEFSSNIPITEMLCYLDRYPLMLPARYNDRPACYTTVYFTSNVPLSAQYLAVQAQQPAVWRAFLRRISRVEEFRSDGRIIVHPVNVN